MFLAVFMKWGDLIKAPEKYGKIIATVSGYMMTDARFWGIRVKRLIRNTRYGKLVEYDVGIKDSKKVLEDLDVFKDEVYGYLVYYNRKIRQVIIITYNGAPYQPTVTQLIQL